MFTEIFLLEILFLFLNLILIVKRIPLLAMPFGVFSIYISATQFLPDTSYIANKIFVIFILIIASVNVLANGADAWESKRK